MKVKKPKTKAKLSSVTKSSIKPSKNSKTNSTKGQQTQERLLNATALLLTEKGFAGTRLSDIAKKAEIQVPAIYYYYESREALIQEVVSRGQQTARHHVENALAELSPEVSFIERIRCAVEAHLTVVLELSGYTTAAIRNVGQLPEHMRLKVYKDQKSYGELWRRLFIEAQNAGEIREDIDITCARLLIIGAINWSPEWWSPKKGKISEIVYAVNALIDGLRP